MNKYGQYSVEYVIVIGFGLLMSIAILMVYFIQSEDLSNKVGVNQLDTIARKIVEVSEKIYYLGEPSQTFLNIYMPNKIRNFFINKGEVTFLMEVNNNLIEIYRTTAINITGNFSTAQGNHKIKIQAINSNLTGVYVLLSEE